MKRNLIVLCMAAFLFSACNNEKKADEDKKEASGTETKNELTNNKSAENKEMPPVDPAAAQKAWEDFMKPGDMHKWMEKTNGTWEAEVSQWMDAATPPTKAQATNVQSSALGGRYVIGKYSSTMMGQPFEGMSTMGYDNAKKMFTSTWVDNMGTGIVHMSGTYDEASKTLNLKGHQTDPMTGKDSDMREEMKMMDDNTYWMAIYGVGMNGKEQKYMEGTFKRKN